MPSSLNSGGDGKLYRKKNMLKLELVKKEKEETTMKKGSRESKGLELTMKALKEIEDGKGTRCKTFEEYKKSISI